MPLRNNIAMAIPEVPGDQKLLERVRYTLIRKFTNFQLPIPNSFWAVLKKTVNFPRPLVQTRINKPLKNYEIFNIQNLICLLLSIPKRRFCYIDILFLFTISQDIESWIRNSDLKIFKMGKKQGISFRQNTEMCLHVIFIYLASVLGWRKINHNLWYIIRKWTCLRQHYIWYK